MPQISLTLQKYSCSLKFKNMPSINLSVKVKVRQDQNDKPFVIECEAEGEPAPEWVTFWVNFLRQMGHILIKFSSQKAKLDFELKKKLCWWQMDRMMLTASRKWVSPILLSDEWWWGYALLLINLRFDWYVKISLCPVKKKHEKEKLGLAL